MIPRGGSDESDESDDTEPMSSEEERPPPRRSKSKERGRSSSRRTAKETKPKGRSQRMMSVQRTDSEGDDPFEERGGIDEDFASGEKLAVEIDHEFRTSWRGRVGRCLPRSTSSKRYWMERETGSMKPAPLVSKIKSEAPSAISRNSSSTSMSTSWLMELADSQHEREQNGTQESKPEGDGSSLDENEQCEQALMGHEEELKLESSRKSSSAIARQNGTGATSRERVCDCRW